MARAKKERRDQNNRIAPGRRTLLVIPLLLIVSAGVRLPGLLSRAIWYDESITLLETSNDRPPWPVQPTLAPVVQKQKFQTPTTLIKVSRDLWSKDVHPPIYYFVLTIWRGLLGFSLEVARSFSLICSIASVLVLYFLLRVAEVKLAFLPALVYALTSASVHYGQEARSYALASLLILVAALSAYLALQTPPQSKQRVTACTIVCGVFCGIAFETNYLALFPVCVILIWFMINLWPVSTYYAFLPALIAAPIWIVGSPLLLKHLGQRASQDAGFIGPLPELASIFQRNLKIVYQPAINLPGLKYVALALFGTLAAISAVQLSRGWQKAPRPLLVLISGLALASSAGLLLLDLLYDKHLDYIGYVMFGGPFVVALLTYGLTTFTSSQRVWQVALLAMVLALQLTGINWGLEQTPGYPGNDQRSLARSIEQSPALFRLVVIGNNWPDISGNTGSLAYELDSQSSMVTFEDKTQVQSLLRSIEGYDDIWLVFFHGGTITHTQNMLLNGMRESGSYVEVSPPMVHRKRFVAHYRLLKNAATDSKVAYSLKVELLALMRQGTLGSHKHTYSIENNDG